MDTLRAGQDGEIFNRFGDVAQGDLRLEPGHVRAKAEVRAHPEAHQPVPVSAVDVVGLGPVEHLGIPVRRADEQEHLFPRRDRGVTDRDLVLGRSQDHLRGRVEAQGLLDPVVDAVRVRQNRVLGFGEVIGPVHRVGQKFRSRFVAGDDHQEEKRQNLVLVEPIAVDLRGDERRGEIIPRLGPPGRDELLVVGDELECGVHRGLGHVEDVLLTVHHLIGQRP